MKLSHEYLTIKARVLAYYGQHPNATVRQCSIDLNSTERTVIDACKELQGNGLMRSTRMGRRCKRTVLASTAVMSAVTTLAGA